MQAIFRFRGAEEIIVTGGPGGIEIEKRSGYREGKQCPACKASGPGCGCPECGEELNRAWRDIFSKSEARALASALMGAAAEL